MFLSFMYILLYRTEYFSDIIVVFAAATAVVGVVIVIVVSAVTAVIAAVAGVAELMNRGDYY